MPDLSLTLSNNCTNRKKSLFLSRYSGENNEKSIENDETLTSTVYYSDYLVNHENLSQTLTHYNSSNHQTRQNGGIVTKIDKKGRPASNESARITKLMNQSPAQERSAIM